MTRSRRARAVLLVELIAMLAMGLLICAVLFKLIDGQAYLHRVAAAHADRAGVMDAIQRRLADDLRAATQVRLDGPTLHITRGPASETAEVVYTFAEDRVARWSEPEAEYVWRAARLEFEWTVTIGTRGRMLLLAFIELPPPRASTVPTRSYPASFILPPAQPAEVAP